ncbi:MAG: endolytic transglycosylase MltG [Betaproteobacteria bacterium]|jgi:UPF0755 protein
MVRVVGVLLFVLAVIMIALASAGVRYSKTPLDLPSQPFEFTVERGTSLKALSRKLADAGLFSEPYSFWLLGKFSNDANLIQAGRYRLTKPISPTELLQKLNDGDVVKVAITFIEGVTFKKMRESLEAHPDIKATLKGSLAKDVLKKLGASEAYPEGLFFPDTYQFSPGTTDLDILRASYQSMQRKLNDAWASRATGLPYKSAYEALIMASIIEKETGRADERPEIAAVFVNRLRLPMRLQTDPTVIYGLGEKFDGNIRKRDLTTDTPYNTYTRDGLPPTPIAMPGLASIQAALNPANSDKLYFVATKNGDGSHAFSSNLADHNRAVSKYQLGR